MKARNIIKNQFTGSMIAPHRFAAHCMQKLHDLKERMTVELSSRFAGMLDEHRLRQVINEADALAATTSFPALFLPTLAEEKVRAAADWEAKQRELYERSRSLRNSRGLPLAA
jgi:hypothetical protein